MNRVPRGIPLIAYLAFENALLFLVIGLFIGGYAMFGKIESGHYYLGHKGYYTDVSALVFTYSRLHEISALVLAPLAVLATLVSRLRSGRRKSQTASGLAVGGRRVFDVAEGFFWRLYDSWRNPTSSTL